MDATSRDMITDESSELNKLQIFEKALGLLESPYESFHAFVRATNAARELGMLDQFEQAWVHWRQIWVVGEGVHLLVPSSPNIIQFSTLIGSLKFLPTLILINTVLSWLLLKMSLLP